MERLDWKKPIRLNILLLRLVGLWPEGDGSYKPDLYILYAIVIWLYQISHIFFQTINMFFILSDLEAMTGTIFILMTKILAVLKTYCLIKNMKMLKRLLTTLDSDQFQPKNLQQRDLIQPNLNAWAMIAISLRSFATVWLLSWCSFPILDKTYTEYRLPFLAVYPFDAKVSPNYELTYFYQFTATAYITLSNINIDTLIAALNMYIGAQFDILCDDLRNLSRDDSRDVYAKLKGCIHHHREILKFADNANKFYNWLLFFQFFVGGISIGVSMFQLTLVVPLSSQFYSFLTYSNGISVEVFMYCWFGNEIEIKSSRLAYAVFESEWVNFPPEVKKDMIFFILRIRNSLKISALGLFSLSLETFMRILRTAWSYFALLRQVNSPT
ncbi:7tm 6 domain containing protein, partial [Asbolus verrucosus]